MNNNIHFIGIAERMMSDLAIALQLQGYAVTGSAEVLLESSQEKLAQAGLLPTQPGWFPTKVTQALDEVIVGRAIQPDNPELQIAQQLGLDIYTYPTYIYEYAQDKQRIVITGGVERTIICAITIHILRYWHRAFDYVVDAPGLETTVQLGEAPIIILQGDALPSSPVDPQPQFLAYQHNIALISGISEEYDEPSPALDGYVAKLSALADASPKGGTLIYDEAKSLVKEVGSRPRTDVKSFPYQAHAHRYKGDQTYLITTQGDIPILQADRLSLRAIAGAQQLLRNVAVTSKQFYEAIPTFSMAEALTI
ncbi:MAG: Mur ligase domain-containing protein [Bacteroidota bacterium]